MKKRNLLALFLCLTLATVLMLAGCAKKEEAEAPAEETTEAMEKKEILLVNHTSLTGGLADYGFAAQEGIELAVEKFSPFTAGNVEYTIKLVNLDDKGDSAEAAVTAQNAVDMGAVAIIGCLTSGNTNAAMPIYDKANIPMISPSATRPDLTELGHSNFFRTCIRDDVQGNALGTWVVDLGYKKVTVMDDRGDYSVAFADVVEETLKAANVEVQREHCQERDTDFSAQINNIKNNDSEAVIFTGYHREGGLLRKQMIENGLKDIQYMGGDGIKSGEIVNEAGGKENAEGTLCTFGLSQADMPGYEEFKTAYIKDTGKEGTGPYSENAYDAVGILVEAIKRAESTNGTDIIEALRNIKYTGIMGTFNFDEKGDIEIGSAVSKYVIKDGSWVPYTQ